MDHYDVYGVGNALVDIQAHVTDDVLQRLGFTKGIMTLVDEPSQQQVLEQLHGCPFHRCAGGSAANTVIGVAEFGGKAAYAGKVGNDALGEFLLDDLRRMGVAIEVSTDSPPTGTCVILITEDAQRTMLTHLGVSSTLGPGDIDENELRKAKYVYIGRDGRDVVWSFYNHHANANDKWYDALNNTPGRVGPPIDKPTDSVRDYFLEWLERDGYPFWSMWDNLRTWWAIRDRPNVLFVHFAELKRDMPGQIRRVAKFLDIPIDESKWDAIVEHCSFDYMKANATKSVPLGGVFWDGGAQVFINKGTNGRWREILTAQDVKRYEDKAREELGQACAHWLAMAGSPD